MLSFQKMKEKKKLLYSYYFSVLLCQISFENTQKQNKTNKKKWHNLEFVGLSVAEFQLAILPGPVTAAFPFNELMGRKQVESGRVGSSFRLSSQTSHQVEPQFKAP